MTRAICFPAARAIIRSEEHTSELQSHVNLVCRLLLEKKKNIMRNGLQLLATCVEQNLERFHDLVSFFFKDTATTEIYTLSLHDALPIYIKWFYQNGMWAMGKLGNGPLTGLPLAA